MDIFIISLSMLEFTPIMVIVQEQIYQNKNSIAFNIKGLQARMFK